MGRCRAFVVHEGYEWTLVHVWGVNCEKCSDFVRSKKQEVCPFMSDTFTTVVLSGLSVRRMVLLLVVLRFVFWVLSLEPL